jgi:uncharacterized membrane protein YesL
MLKAELISEKMIIDLKKLICRLSITNAEIINYSITLLVISGMNIFFNLKVSFMISVISIFRLIKVLCLLSVCEESFISLSLPNAFLYITATEASISQSMAIPTWLTMARNG